MNIQILTTLNDKDKILGCVVIIDVLRASNTIIECLLKGAARVITVSSLEEAFALKKHHPDWLIFGERNGVKIEGFDGDNSPTQVSKRGVLNKVIVLTTSGGTRCITACDAVQDVIIGSFANAHAIVNYLNTEQKKSDITLWAVGKKAQEPALEDELCAKYIQGLLLGKSQNVESIRSRILQSSGVKYLNYLGLTKDLDYCLNEKRKQIVPKRSKTLEGRVCFTSL